MIRESAKKTPEYAQFKRECNEIMEIYSEKIYARFEEQKRLNLRGKDDKIINDICRERNKKIKELQKKYQYLYE